MVLCNHAINGSHAMTPLYSKIGKAPRSTDDITRQLLVAYHVRVVHHLSGWRKVFEGVMEKTDE